MDIKSNYDKDYGIMTSYLKHLNRLKHATLKKSDGGGVRKSNMILMTKYLVTFVKVQLTYSLG